MTSAQSDDGYEFDCDLCGANWNPPRLGIGSEKPTWRECFDAAKAEGWRAIKITSSTGDIDWEHRCPNCA